jgi:hypothetical protein
MAGRGEAGNLTFYDRKLHPANPGGLARAEDARLRGFLKLIHFDEAIPNTAFERASKLEVRNEMKSASQVIAFDFAEALVIRDLNRMHTVLPKCRDRPSAREIWRTPAAESELRRFHKFSGKPCHRQRERTELREGCLLTDAQDLGPAFAQVSGHRQEERASSSDDDTLAIHGQTGFHQSLEASGAQDVRQSPTREGQKKFTCTGCEN